MRGSVGEQLSVAQRLRLAYAEWQSVHEAVHGPLTLAEADVAQEVASFLITVAQADEK